MNFMVAMRRCTVLIFLSPILFFSFNCRSMATQSEADGYGGSSKGTTHSAVPSPTSEAAPESPKPMAKKSVAKKTARMVVYVGQIAVEVFELKEKTTALEALAKNLGGFIESNKTTEDYARIVLRVPVKRFNEALESISNEGRVLSREVSAADITKEFSDLETRLKNNIAVRERLYTLLKSAKKVKARLKILQEINRITQLITADEERLKNMASAASYSTVIATLQLFKSPTTIRMPSPFSWIASLVPERRSILTYKDIELPLPASFFDYEKEFKKEKVEALFISARQSKIRAGRVKNDPKADAVFWRQALEKEMLSRGYVKKSRDDVDTGSIQLYSYVDGLEEHFYLIAFFTREKYLYVIEAYYPNKQELDELDKNVRTSIKEVKIHD
ncbi:MAG TPA: DUF4349 domain-containing protein [Turneriella sp.]|nr:DUF4349 domain-containing protein [Turneriella sp.]